MALIYHTFFKEYRGQDAESLLRAVHDDAKTGTGLDYAAWWAQQQSLWAARYDLVIPGPDAAGAADKMLAALIHVGALESGPMPPVPAAKAPRHG